MNKMWGCRIIEFNVYVLYHPSEHNCSMAGQYCSLTVAISHRNWSTPCHIFWILGLVQSHRLFSEPWPRPCVRFSNFFELWPEPGSGSGRLRFEPRFRTEHRHHYRDADGQGSTKQECNTIDWAIGWGGEGKLEMRRKLNRESTWMNRDR